MWIGRPVLWGLAYKGQKGVELALKLFRDEIKLCMALAGTTKVDQISKEYLVKVSETEDEFAFANRSTNVDQMDRSGFVSRL